MTVERKKDVASIAFLMMIAVLIFNPLFSSTYVYTDEIVQLWLYRPGSGFQMFHAQGRFITEKLFRWLFSSTNTIAGIKYIRLFSFSGWILSIPVWYVIIKRIVKQEKLPEILAFFTTLYLISTPQVSIYVGWASCLELFLACTAALMAGYFFYVSFNYNLSALKRWSYILLSILLGLISLFTYQSGFCCFLLPFLLHLFAKRKFSQTLVIGISFYLMIYVIYYFIFRYGLYLEHAAASERASIQLKPVSKLKFLFTRALPSSFNFTYIFNERSIVRLIIYTGIFGAWCIYNLADKSIGIFRNRVIFILLVLLSFPLLYIPSLLVNENYASNRTLLALNLAVFVLLAITLLRMRLSEIIKTSIVALASVLFVFNAGYNFRHEFVIPVRREYAMLKDFISINYKSNTDTVYFIRPEEDFFVRKYGTTRSWDEFGVPSSFFDWVPEFLVKQIVFEKTGSRIEADRLVIQHWPGRKAYDESRLIPDDRTMFIEAEKIMQLDSIRR